jgi:hypothetical protein
MQVEVHRKSAYFPSDGPACITGRLIYWDTHELTDKPPDTRTGGDRITIVRNGLGRRHIFM